MSSAFDPKLTKAEIAKIYQGLGKAGLDNFRIVSLHLAPAPRSVGAAASDPGGNCHSVELTNGHVFITCDGN